MKIVEVSKVDFDNYAKTNKNRNFYQTSQYGTLMSKHGYTDYYVALIDDYNNILAASLILIQKLFGGFKFAYSPRGFLIDFNDFDLVKTYSTLLTSYLNKRGVLYLKIDPYVVHIKRDVKGIPVEECNNTHVIENLKNLGFEHSGFNLYFETLKPRWNAVLNVNKPYYSLYDSFDKNTRAKIRKAERKGIKVYKGSKDDIKLFYSLVDKKHTRKLNYYLDYYDIFGKQNMIDLYFAKIDINSFLKNSKMLYENEIKNNNDLIEKMQKNIGNNTFLNQKMESDKLLNMYKEDVLLANKLYQVGNKDIVVATSAIIKYDKEVFFLIDGYDSKYKNFNANYLLKYKIIESLAKEGYTSFHLNGISGDFDPKSKYYGLYDFKTGFDANVTEYIGEFNLIINTLYYRTYKNIKPFEGMFNRKLKKN